MALQVTKNAPAPRPFKRTGMHRIECPACPGYAYATVAMLESIGFPVCPCGETFRPERLELALLLGVDHPDADHVERDGYNRESSQVRALGGYQRASDRFSGLTGPVPTNMHLRALEAHRALERETARERRLAALNRGTTSGAAAAAAAARELESIPF